VEVGRGRTQLEGGLRIPFEKKNMDGIILGYGELKDISPENGRKPGKITVPRKKAPDPHVFKVGDEARRIVGARGRRPSETAERDVSGVTTKEKGGEERPPGGVQGRGGNKGMTGPTFLWPQVPSNVTLL